MDLSTMKQKIDDNLYGDMHDFVEDFKLMCTNAMEYNHVDTVYYKASKKLLHAGLKLFQPEKIGWLLQLIPELTNKDFGKLDVKMIPFSCILFIYMDGRFRKSTKWYND